VALLHKPKRPTLPPGTVLDDRFEVEDLLGAGSFGAVYRAKQLVFGKPLRTVALKLFAADRVSPASVREVFSDAITLIGLQEQSPDPEVGRRMIQVYDIGLLKSPAPQAFMSMKLVPGKKTLEASVNRWRHARMPVATSLELLGELLIPLAWMHTREVPVVHGDLKPDNVLQGEDDRTLILTDFGLAAHVPLGSFGGAVAYQAPENLAGHTAGTPADVYAVGLIWYEMLTGRHPFDGVGLEGTAAGDDAAYVRAQQAARKWPVRKADPDDDSPRIAPASESNAELRSHPQLEAVLNRCLAYWEADRYPNARLLLDDLNAYRAGGAVAGATPVRAAPPPPPTAAPALPQKTAAALVADAAALLQGGQFPESLAAAEGAARKDPKSVPARLAQARALVALKRADAARQCCTDAQALAPDDPDILAVLAEVLEAMGKAALAHRVRDQERDLRAKKRR